jgi:hypothetical protein
MQPTLAILLLVTMQHNNTGVVGVSMELLRLRLPSNDGLQSNTSHYISHVGLVLIEIQPVGYIMKMYQLPEIRNFQKGYVLPMTL